MGMAAIVVKAVGCTQVSYIVLTISSYHWPDILLITPTKP